MPPRPRKAAAARPAADDAGLPPQAPAPEESDRDAPPPVETGALTDVAESAAVHVVEPMEVPEPVPVAPKAPTSHWELVGLAGIEDTPCRQCLHGGAPVGVGCIGCSHGQWALVWDGA